MKLKKAKFDILSIVLLIVLVILEFYIEKDEVFHSAQTFLCLTIGLMVGFNLGYKFSSMHSMRVSEEAFNVAKTQEKKLDQKEKAHKKIIAELEVALQREKKLTKSLGLNLQDRDNEIKELISLGMTRSSQ